MPVVLCLLLAMHVDGVALPLPGASLWGVCTARDLLLWLNGYPALQGFEARLGRDSSNTAVVVG